MLVNMRVAWRPPSVKGGAPRIRFAVTARGTANVRRATTLFDSRKPDRRKPKRRSSFTSGPSVPPRQPRAGPRWRALLATRLYKLKLRRLL